MNEDPPAVVTRALVNTIEAAYPEQPEVQTALGVGKFSLDILETSSSEALPAREVPVVRSTDGSRVYQVTAFGRIQRAGTLASRGLAKPFEVWFWGPDGRHWYGSLNSDSPTLTAKRLP